RPGAAAGRRADRQPRRRGRRRRPAAAPRRGGRGPRGADGHARGGRDGDGRPRAGAARRAAGGRVIALALAGLRARRGRRGLADAWGLRPGGRLFVGDGVGELRIAGIAVSPDNVAYPLAKAARVYVDVRDLARRLGFDPARTDANMALLWLNDPAKADVTL